MKYSLISMVPKTYEFPLKKTQIVFSIMGEIQNMKTTLALTLTYLSNK